MGCRACGSPGGGCQFLGTAATAQVVAEAFGLTLPHSALSPSGEPVWLEMARRSARALVQLAAKRITLAAHPDAARARERDAAPRGLRRLDQPPAAHPGDRPRRGPAAAHGRRLEPRQPRDAAARRRAAERAAQPSDRAGVHGGRRARGDAAPARDGPAEPGRRSRSRARTLGAVLDWWESSERRQRGARAAAGGRRRRSRPRHHGRRTPRAGRA